MEEPVACEVCAQLVWGVREGAGVSEHKHAQGILFRIMAGNQIISACRVVFSPSLCSTSLSVKRAHERFTGECVVSEGNEGLWDARSVSSCLLLQLMET